MVIPTAEQAKVDSRAAAAQMPARPLLQMAPETQAVQGKVHAAPKLHSVVARSPGQASREVADSNARRVRAVTRAPKGRRDSQAMAVAVAVDARRKSWVSEVG